MGLGVPCSHEPVPHFGFYRDLRGLLWINPRPDSLLTCAPVCVVSSSLGDKIIENEMEQKTENNVKTGVVCRSGHRA